MPASVIPDGARAAPVAGLLLAAGTSSRMGANKLLFEVGGRSLLRTAALRAVEAGLAPVYVVLGHEAGLARRELDDIGCEVVLNRDYEQGITSSLTAGVSALGSRVPAVVVMLADMPRVDAPMIASLVARYRSASSPLVISDYEGVNAPPVLYDRSLFGELRSLTGDGGCGRQVVARHRSEAEVLHWPASALADIDDPEDFARVRGTT
ncbi:MAG: NTP transferase domain-containing protein [Gemmatimonadales bacterium]